MVAADSGLRPVLPGKVLAEIAEAIPKDCRGNIIIIGSLAVGYRYLRNKVGMAVRTKDADCLLSPRVTAVDKGVAIVDRLVDAGWTFKASEEWRKPGTMDTPVDGLPAVRLCPPSNTDWFLELLAAPASPDERGKMWTRLETKLGDFGLCSFGYLSLAEYRPIETDLGISVARPEMMALANLLEHPVIGDETMSKGFAGRREIKRSNKDLGRVVAIARFAIAEDEDALQAWPETWLEGLSARFASESKDIARGVGGGFEELLASRNDMEQAWFTCTAGLLADMQPTLEEFHVTASRVLAYAIEPFREVARSAHEGRKRA